MSIRVAARLFALPVIVLMALGPLLGLAVPVARAAGTTLVVAPLGADTNPGSAAAPLRTIQRCATIAGPGDTCLIRAGTYRETVIPPTSGTAGSPIAFRAYPGEQVTVSGAEILGGWSSQSGAIYKAAMPWTMVTTPTSFAGTRPNSSDQLFVDGQMMVTARWPNIPVGRATELRRQDNVRAEAAEILNPNGMGNSNQARYTSSRLGAFAPNSWQGGWINFMPGYGISANTCAVTGNSGNTVSLACPPGDTFKSGDRYHRPSIGNPFYLWGKIEALDYPGEWFRAADGTLSLWLPGSDSPVSHVVEAKRRLYAFDLSDREYLTISGIDLFAATIKTSATTRHLTLDALDAKYLWHFDNYRLPAWDDGSIYGMYGLGGLVLEGEQITLSNSEIAFSAASGVILGGKGNRVSNTVIRNTGYMAGSDAIGGAGSSDQSARNRIEQSTVFNAGRIGVNLGSATDLLTSDVYNTHLQAVDFGAVYARAVDGKGATVAYNLVHDAKAEYDAALNYWGTYGIYLDDDTYNFTVARNIVWNTSNAGMGVVGNSGTIIAPPLPATQPSNRRFFNNSVDGQLWANEKNGQPLLGVEFRNNIAARERLYPTPGSGVVSTTNLLGRNHWVDYKNQDFQLRDGSEAIDTAQPLPPFTDGAAGAGPDIGALEHGATPWSAGALLRARDVADLDVACTADSASKQADCTVEGLPLGRRLPTGFALRIGAAPGSSNCTATMDYTSHTAFGSCAGVGYGDQEGQQPILARLGDEWLATGSTIDLGGSAGPPLAPAISSVSPASGPIAGGTRITISGRNFDTSTGTYRLPISIANPAQRALSAYPVLLTLDTAALIRDGKLQASCADLRFNDEYSQLDYWIETGCNSSATRVWVKLEALGPQGDTIWLTYGDEAREAASSGARTFVFFDDFDDDQRNPAIDMADKGAITVRETGGQMRISGTSDEATQYDSVGFNINSSLVEFPAAFAVDSALSAVAQPADSYPKIGIGGADTMLMLYADYTDGGNRKVGYWNGTQWVAHGDSGIESLAFDAQQISVGYQGTTIYYFENGQQHGSRSEVANPLGGFFAYSPNAPGRSFDVRFDNVRLRPFAFPEPQATLGAETPPAATLSVTVGEQPCGKVIITRPTSLSCVVAAAPAGPVPVAVRNPDGQQASLPNGFTYVATTDGPPPTDGTLPLRYRYLAIVLRR